MNPFLGVFFKAKLCFDCVDLSHRIRSLPLIEPSLPHSFMRNPDYFMKIKNQLFFLLLCFSFALGADESLREAFMHPPDSARPGVYWYFNDGNMNEKEMIEDLRSMKEAGLRRALFLEVNVGVPQGKVKMMSEPWLDNVSKSFIAAEKMGIDIVLGTGPGWCGAGGPWVKPEEAMQHLVTSEIEVKGPSVYEGELPLGKQHFTQWAPVERPYYEDVAVYAFPRSNPRIGEIEEKALYYRGPISSDPNVNPFLSEPGSDKEKVQGQNIDPRSMIDLTKFLKPGGKLRWEVPPGDWTILRMTRRNTGVVTRPAPEAGIGQETDKLSAKPVEDHLDYYVGSLIKKIGVDRNPIKTLHSDSWEVGAQNWTKDFLNDFHKRRGYDARPLLPIFSGRVIEEFEKSERFLWDVRQTCSELVTEVHTIAMKNWGSKHGMNLSIEPYDMNPAGDFNLGACADIPMGEFWKETFNSSFSVWNATSIGHVLGKKIVATESFTSAADPWIEYPTSIKNQGDWALTMGINRFFFHTFAHQPFGDQNRPGMTFGPYGVNWNRGQTWWPMVEDYHDYLSRCSHLMQQGTTTAELLYLTGEDAPCSAYPPEDAFEGVSPILDKRGYGFDLCSPKILIEKASVREGRIVFPGGASYSMLVLPKLKMMTPPLITKIKELVQSGATIVGNPPLKSPSLTNYPTCDQTVRKLSQEIWGSLKTPSKVTHRPFGLGSVYWGGELNSPVIPKVRGSIYPSYEATSKILKSRGVLQDFIGNGKIRYAHHQLEDGEFYFISNRTNEKTVSPCVFRVATGTPELWNPISGETTPLVSYEQKGGVTALTIPFESHQSYFIFFKQKKGNDLHHGQTTASNNSPSTIDFPNSEVVLDLSKSWEVSFDPRWGGPKKTSFETLHDWTTSDQRGIKYYSGIAAYSKTFNFTPDANKRVYLNLGVVHDMARVYLNGKDLGVVWTAPWEVELTQKLKKGKNELKIEVVNRWPNRLIGDSQPEDANVRTLQWPEGLLEGKKIQTGRYTFTNSTQFYKADSPLLPSGLLGPVTLEARTK